MKFSSALILWISINITAHCTHVVLLKFSSQCESYSIRQAVLFILANLVGLVATFAAMAALRDNNPILVYAILGGGGAFVLYLTLWLIFKPSISYWQWIAIALIAVGVILLNRSSEKVGEERVVVPAEAKARP